MSREIVRAPLWIALSLQLAACGPAAPHTAAPPTQVLGSATPEAGGAPVPQVAPASAYPTSTPALEQEIARVRPHIQGYIQARAQNVPAAQLAEQRQAIIGDVQSGLAWKVPLPTIEARVDRALRETSLPPQAWMGVGMSYPGRIIQQRMFEGPPTLPAEIERERPDIVRAAELQNQQARREANKLQEQIIARIHARIGGHDVPIRIQVQNAIMREAIGPGGGLIQRQAKHSDDATRQALESLGSVDLSRMPQAYRDGYAGRPEEATRLYRAEFERTQKIEALTPWQHVNQSGRDTAHYVAHLEFQLDGVLSLAQQNPNDAALQQLGYELVLSLRARSAEVERRISAALAEQPSDEARAARSAFLDVRTAIAQLELRRASGVTLSASEERELAGHKRSEHEASARLDALASLGRAMDRPFAVAGASERLRGSLKPEQALVSLIAYRAFTPEQMSDPSTWTPSYGAFVLTPRGLAWRALGPAAAIDAQVDAFLRAIGSSSVPLARKKQVSQALYEVVLAKVAEPLAGSTQWTVVADGSLQLVPFEALHDARGWLADDHQIGYAVSERQLAGEYRPRVIAGTPLLAVGGPYNATPVALRRGEPLTQAHFPQLAGTRAEVADVRSLLPEAELLSDAQASDALLRRAKPPRILHVAAHGVFLPLDVGAGANDRGLALKSSAASTAATAPTPAPAPAPASANIGVSPLRREDDEATNMTRSALVLASAGGAHDDGFLTGYEVAASDLWGTDLVVLSACETGRGAHDRVRGVQGLRRAFYTAGAESLLISLWSVDDRATRLLMQSFYRKLAEGVPRGEALQQASKVVRAQNPDPYYWAPFVLVGATSPLRATSLTADATAGEDEDSRLARGLQARRSKRTHYRVGSAQFTLDGKSQVALDTHLQREHERPGRPLVLTLLGKEASVSVTVARYTGVGRYRIGSAASASAGPVSDPLAVDITKLPRERGQIAASEGVLEISADSVDAGLRGHLSLRLTDGRTLEGDLALDAQLPDLPGFMRKR